ncbi:MAG: catalase [Clostridiaceae bacterium]|nr:catalase [Clostridiaceae bacterium]
MRTMSDRGIPRSYRMMESFGVHTFRFINESGKSTFVKVHFKPIAISNLMSFLLKPKMKTQPAPFF